MIFRDTIDVYLYVGAFDVDSSLDYDNALSVWWLLQAERETEREREREGGANGD